MASAPSARQAMVDAAERLVAERGLGAVSLREVQVRAGQRNKSAAHYHFGSRDGLIEAIVESRMASVNERRLSLLADLDADGRGEEVRGLVEALVLPLAEATLGRPGSYYARFLAQATADPGASVLVTRHLRAESFRSACDRLLERAKATSGLPDVLGYTHIERIVSMAIFSLAGWEGGRFVDDLPMEARLSDLIDACIALVGAPVSEPTRAALAARPHAPTATAATAATARPHAPTATTATARPHAPTAATAEARTGSRGDAADD